MRAWDRLLKRVLASLCGYISVVAMLFALVWAIGNGPAMTWVVSALWFFFMALFSALICEFFVCSTRRAFVSGGMAALVVMRLLPIMDAALNRINWQDESLGVLHRIVMYAVAIFVVVGVSTVVALQGARTADVAVANPQKAAAP